eukprot:CAMPEP_0174984542 /NCGR_PEP_ID=MMETSP0004_2-20121128/17785_1 /TAXON_ID=420556 /ORGANISM="Ochromonas sp., Strain CCMP1393" /LENGTH=335 /DNA_ID=CAMNT_0016236973 /DNA_START=264 /DNA_END=1271 /DNA_ORIENTATION=+
MANEIPIVNFYVDDTNNGEETHFRFSMAYINTFMKSFNKKIDKIRSFLRRNQNEESDVQQQQIKRLPHNDWFYFAVNKYEHAINNSKVVVFGSMEPFAEVAALALGAAHVSTVEYNNLTINHSSISTFSKFDFSTIYDCEGKYVGSYDVGISLSSFDHDGLGRYGDPLDPEGDLKAMSRAWMLLKPSGLLFLTVPIGSDLVVFNLLRRYGRVRLPLLLRHWEVVEKLFWEEDKLYQDPAGTSFRRSYEPVLVLRKPAAAAGAGAFRSLDEAPTGSGKLSIQVEEEQPMHRCTPKTYEEDDDKNIRMQQLVDTKSHDSNMADTSTATSTVSLEAEL